MFKRMQPVIYRTCGYLNDRNWKAACLKLSEFKDNSDTICDIVRWLENQLFHSDKTHAFLYDYNMVTGREITTEYTFYDYTDFISFNWALVDKHFPTLYNKFIKKMKIAKICKEEDEI